MACAQDAQNLGKMWFDGNLSAIRILDSWGKPSAGIMEGDTAWLGRPDECVSLPNGLQFSTDFCVTAPTRVKNSFTFRL